MRSSISSFHRADDASYKKDPGALEDVLKNTFIYLEPKSDSKGN